MSRPVDVDEQLMRIALRAARRGLGAVEPNPPVGCVITRNGRELARGYHRRFGGPHAEVDALRRCDRAHGATIYVTLEPCCYHGKTPPCTRALIDAGVSRVVAAVRDPNPRVAGKGLAALRRAGIRVDVGLLADEAAELIAPFRKLTRHGRPWVIAKWAQSIDGRIATRTGDSKWISDHAARRHAHRIRGRVDAIIIGVATARTDDPLLTARHARPRRVATRIVLDPHLRTPLRSQLVRTARDIPTWICCEKKASARSVAHYANAGCRVITLPTGRSGRLQVTRLLDQLGRERMTNVLVEGGADTLGGFFDQRLVDELHIYTAPRLIGGRDALAAIGGVGPAAVANALQFAMPAQVRRLGDGWFLRALL